MSQQTSTSSAHKLTS